MDSLFLLILRILSWMMSCSCLRVSRFLVISALLLGEAMTPANVLGAALILGGAIYSELGEKLRLRAAGNRMATA